MQKNDIALRAYMVTVLRTGSDRFGQVWTSQNRCEALFFLNRESHAVQIWPTPKPACSFLTVPRLKLDDPLKWWKRPSSRFNWCNVWTGVKCNFSWEHFQTRYIIRKLSLSRIWMWNFTRIGPKTKKLWLLIIPALRLSYQSRLGQPQKGVNRNFSWSHLDKSYIVQKLSISEA